MKSKSELAIADLEAVVQIGLDLLLQSSDNLTIQVSTLLHSRKHALVAIQFLRQQHHQQQHTSFFLLSNTKHFAAWISSISSKFSAPLELQNGFFQVPEFLNQEWNFFKFQNLIKNEFFGVLEHDKEWFFFEFQSLITSEFFEFYNLIKKEFSASRKLIKIFFEFPEVDQEVFGVGVNLEILLKKI